MRKRTKQIFMPNCTLLVLKHQQPTFPGACLFFTSPCCWWFFFSLSPSLSFWFRHIRKASNYIKSLMHTLIFTYFISISYSFITSSTHFIIISIPISTVWQHQNEWKTHNDSQIILWLLFIATFFSLLSNNPLVSSHIFSVLAACCWRFYGSIELIEKKRWSHLLKSYKYEK